MKSTFSHMTEITCSAYETVPYVKCGDSTTNAFETCSQHARRMKPHLHYYSSITLRVFPSVNILKMTFLHAKLGLRSGWRYSV